MNNSLQIYLLPGLGVDDRLFDHLQLKYPCTTIKWLPFNHKESLPQYALRLADQIDFSEEVILIGVSFGGMLAVEIAKKYSNCKVILVSSAATRSELPFTIKLMAYLPIHNLFRHKQIIDLACRFRFVFGINKQNLPLFREMLQSCPKPYFPRAISSIAGWNNHNIPHHTFRLHGTKDRLISAKYCPQEQQHPEGKHYMIYDQGLWCSERINEWIAK